ncbi:hypothetical protein NOCA270046 [metagenome]|uniref:Uncharacterized protein n=1 Tax=metagenome TaxID=256318 RepID=A0A2P2CDF2_9ZZZZ
MWMVMTSSWVGLFGLVTVRRGAPVVWHDDPLSEYEEDIRYVQCHAGHLPVEGANR